MLSLGFLRRAHAIVGAQRRSPGANQRRRIRHAAHDGQTRAKPVFQLAQACTGSDGDQQGPLALQGVVQARLKRGHDLRLDRQHDDFCLGHRKLTVGVADYAEIPAQCLARFGQRFGHAEVVRSEAGFQQAANETARHVAAADERNSCHA